MIFANNRGGPAKLAEISKIKLASPEDAGSQWEGISHHNLTKRIKSELEKQQWVVRDTSAFVSANNLDCAVAVKVHHMFVTSASNHDCYFGAFSSNDRRKALTIYCGSGSEESAFVFEKYTVGGRPSQRPQWADIGEGITEGVRHLSERMKRCLARTVKTLQDEFIEPQKVAEILQETGRKRILPWSKIGLVDAAFHRGVVFNCWNLIEAFGNVNRSSPPMMQLERLSRFHQLMSKHLLQTERLKPGDRNAERGN